MRGANSDEWSSNSLQWDHSAKSNECLGYLLASNMRTGESESPKSDILYSKESAVNSRLRYAHDK